MPSKTVLAHLARRFCTQQENLATEALNFILTTSSAASRALSEFVRQAGVSCPADFRFETQRGGLDGSIPDIQCFDSNGKLRLILENKFWAELTENQPVTYLYRRPAALFFVVPESRLPILWREVIRRCEAKEIKLSSVDCPSAITAVKTSLGPVMAMTSWRALLDALASESPRAGEVDRRTDIAQLRGLCDMIDEEEMMPLKPDEITNREMALRVMNFEDLAQAIVERSTSMGLCTKDGRNESHLRYASGAVVRIADYQAWIGFDVLAWYRKGVSPIWVIFRSQAQMAEIGERLSPLKTASPKRFFETEQNRFVMVPILLRPEVERCYLVEDAVGQIRDLAEMLGATRQPAAEPVTILEAGIDGGTITLFGDRDALGKWKFWMNTDETSYEDLLDENDIKGVEGLLATSSEPVTSFSEALSMLGKRYRWWSFIPLKIHPEFRADIVREVQMRGTPEEMARWQEFASLVKRAEPSG